MSFFTELKRRNVFKVGMVYVIVAWLLIQVVSIVVPAYQAPGWVMPIFITLIAIGFPLALILAWAFELTPEGIKPTQSVIPSESIRKTTGKKLNHFIIILLSFTVIFLVIDNYVWVDKAGKEKTSAPAKVTDKEKPVAVGTTPTVSMAAARTIRSIAVLPLDNYSGDPGQDYFAEGMTDQLTTELAMISRLRVISRGSTTQFKGDKRPPTPEIASCFTWIRLLKARFCESETG